MKQACLQLSLLLFQEGPTDKCPGVDGEKKEIEDQSSVVHTVMSLDPCSPYTFTVYAGNQGGDGDDSSTDNHTTVGGKNSSIIKI